MRKPLSNRTEFYSSLSLGLLLLSIVPFKSVRAEEEKLRSEVYVHPADHSDWNFLIVQGEHAMLFEFYAESPGKAYPIEFGKTYNGSVVVDHSPVCPMKKGDTTRTLNPVPGGIALNYGEMEVGGTSATIKDGAASILISGYVKRRIDKTDKGFQEHLLFLRCVYTLDGNGVIDSDVQSNVQGEKEYEFVLQALDPKSEQSLYEKSDRKDQWVFDAQKKAAMDNGFAAPFIYLPHRLYFHRFFFKKELPGYGSWLQQNYY